MLIRPGAQRLRGRIANSIGSALGRQVEIGSVSIHLLPQPGFDLGNFVVHDDPSFSAEPMLLSDDVTAVLRVSSLFRGRLEIARLSLTEPSVNLVRNRGGHWNLENLLERAARTPVAPTGKTSNETRPSFPYIEADHGRINFKFGAEKKPYALTDAGFSFWQDSENAWGMRLRAQPVRTDFNLSDTGLLRVNGSWQRAASLRQTPVEFTLLWEHPQLGQLTKLVLGSDKGWRGSVTLSTTLKGTPADLDVQTQAAIEDFRRYDILSGGSLRLNASCGGHFSSTDRQFSNILCNAPVGSGGLSLNGSVDGVPGALAYRLTLAARDVPGQALVSLFRRVKRDVPEDLTATGKFDGIVRFERDKEGFSWTGSGQALSLRLRSTAANESLAVDALPIAFSSGPPAGLGSRGLRIDPRATSEGVPRNRSDIGPFELEMGKFGPAVVQGWLGHDGYELHIGGGAEIERLLDAARLVGFPAPHPAANGDARLDLRIAGLWSGFGPPRATGRAQLRNVRAEVRGLNGPLEITSAGVTLSPDQIVVQDLSASIADMSWRGSLTLPRPCGFPNNCFVHFDLHADRLSTDDLNQLLNPNARKRPWYRFLSPNSQAGAPFLMRTRASGKLAADRVVVRNLVATKVLANVTLDNGKVRAADLRGDVLGGKHIGEWRADFLSRPPQYAGSGRLEHFALGQLAQAMRDDWITGTATASYQATTLGFTAAELFSNAEATLQADARDSVLAHIELGDQAGPLHLRHLRAKLILHDGTFEIHDGKLETLTAAYQLSGTASLEQILDLKLVRSGGPGFGITGTLTKPHVTASTAPETEAVLKP